ncbi:hypothetical protein Emag_006351 [Eimeria magna]
MASGFPLRGGVAASPTRGVLSSASLAAALSDSSKLARRKTEAPHPLAVASERDAAHGGLLCLCLITDLLAIPPEFERRAQEGGPPCLTPCQNRGAPTVLAVAPGVASTRPFEKLAAPAAATAAAPIASTTFLAAVPPAAAAETLHQHLEHRPQEQKPLWLRLSFEGLSEVWVPQHVTQEPLAASAAAGVVAFVPAAAAQCRCRLLARLPEEQQDNSASFLFKQRMSQGRLLLNCLHVGSVPLLPFCWRAVETREVDALDELHDDIAHAKEKWFGVMCGAVGQLQKVQQRRLLQVFGDSLGEAAIGREVEAQTAADSLSVLCPSQLFRRCELKLQQLRPQDASASNSVEQVRKRCQGEDLLSDPRESTAGSVQAGFNEEYGSELHVLEAEADIRREVQQRQDSSRGSLTLYFSASLFLTFEEVAKVAQSIAELHQMFRDTATLVIEQGTVLDRIDYNLEQVAEHAEQATAEIQKAEESRRSGRAAKSCSADPETYLILWTWHSHGVPACCPSQHQPANAVSSLSEAAVSLSSS